MQMNSDLLREWRARLQHARDPGLLTFVGAVLLMSAPLLPGLSRVVVLPALLLAPGYALLRLLRQADGMRSISVAVPVSLVLAICTSLILYVGGVRLSPLTLGPLLGGLTLICLIASYGRHLLGGAPEQGQHTPSDDHELAGPDATLNERR